MSSKPQDTGRVTSLKVVRSGDIHRLRDIEESTITDELPVGLYDVGCEGMELTPILTKQDLFEIPEKIYGEPRPHCERILKSFEMQKSKGLGVLLSGTKGTGKSLTAKLTANEAVNVYNLPVLFVGGAGIPVSVLTQITEKLTQPVVIFIDEFEKAYRDADTRNGFLTLMDGVNSGNILWVLTVNDENIGEYFISRPSRIRYHFRYSYLTRDVIDQIIDDNLKGKLASGTKENLMMFPSLSFDSLIEIIREVKLFKEVPDKFIDFFNVKLEDAYYAVTYDRKVMVYDGEIAKDIEAYDKLEPSEKPFGTGTMKRVLDENLFDTLNAEQITALPKRIADSIKEVDITYVSSYAKPIHRSEDNSVYLNCYLRKENFEAVGKSSYDLNWGSEDIASTERVNGTLIFTHTNGDIVRITPTISNSTNMMY